MEIKSLRIAGFASIREMEIPHFAPGLNIVSGDNEAGKSTLLTALRAAFFIKHRAVTDTVRDFAPYDGVGRPEVEVAFSLQGTDYHLQKAFLSKTGAQLRWPGGTLEGDAVEDRLAELLGFSHPGRGASKTTEHQGAFGLLWVEQGRSPLGVDVGAGRDMLAASLEGEVGEILGGEQGRRLLAAARAHCDRFFTATMRPKADSPLRQAEERVAQAREALNGHRETLRAYEQKLNRLADRRAKLAAYEEAHTAERADEALVKAEKAASLLAGVQAEAHQAGREVELVRQLRARAADTLEQRQIARKASLECAAEVEKLAAELDLVRRQARLATETLSAEEAAFAEALAAEDAAEKAERAARETADQQRLRQERDRLGKELAAASQTAHALAELGQADTAVKLDDTAMQALENAWRALREAEIRLDAASSTIRFEPSSGGGVTDAQGAPVATGADIRVSGQGRFVLEGFGAIVVSGGGAARDLTAQVDEAQRLWARLLSQTGCATLDEARGAARKAQERRVQRKQLESELARQAPEGLAALERRVAELIGQVADTPATGTDMDIPALASRYQALRRQRQDAELTLSRARQAQAELTGQLIRLEAAHEHAVGRLQAMQAQLIDADRGASDEVLENNLANADRDLRAAEAVLAARQRQLDSADGEAVRLELDRARRAREQIAVSLRELVLEIHGLEGELRVEGASSLEEEIARLEGEIERGEERIVILKREADASQLLLQTLESCRQEARELWLGPIKNRVAPYLRLLEPDGDIEFDDQTLEIRQLRRNGMAEEFRRLSQGAREQVAIVARLAMAEALKSSGHPAVVILDDALVNTDEKRLARMHLVLARAAERMQVIILTCRERDFVSIGAPIHRI